MYFFSAQLGYTFVSVKDNRKTKRLKIKTTSVLLFFLAMTLPNIMVGQASNDIWPGDVNNDGVVSHTDLVYWRSAIDETGAVRTFADTSTFIGQPKGPEWGKTFPNGVDFQYADVDGSGLIDTSDFRIIKKFFGRSLPGFGAPLGGEGTLFDPKFVLNKLSDDLVKSGETVTFDVALDDDVKKIGSFQSLFFTVKYNRNLIPDDQGGGLDKEEDISFDFSSSNNWMGIIGTEVDTFTLIDKFRGEVTISLNRIEAPKINVSPTTVVTFIVVVEDLIFGYGVDDNVAEFETKMEDLKYFDGDNENIPLFVDPNNKIVIDILTDGSTGSNEFEANGNHLDVFPIPNDGELIVEVREGTVDIETVEIFDAHGRLLINQVVQSPKTRIDLQHMDKGVYVLKVNTKLGVITRLISK